jgi:hypothetical protein
VFVDYNRCVLSSSEKISQFTVCLISVDEQVFTSREMVIVVRAGASVLFACVGIFEDAFAIVCDILQFLQRQLSNPAVPCPYPAQCGVVQ